jgi:uncharacterized protein (TIRG00374 family)
VTTGGQLAAPLPAKRALRALGGLAAGLGAMVVAGRWLGIRPRDVVHELSGASPFMVAGCVASCFVVFGLQSLRWHLVMGPVLGLRYAQAYRAQVVGTMFNAILPARGGDLLRVQYLGRRTGKSRAKILGTEVVDRWLDWWGWIPVLLGLAAAGSLPHWMFTVLGVLGSLLVGAALGLLLLVKLGRTPGPGSRFADAYRGFREGVKAFATVRTLVLAFTVAPLPWIWESLVLRAAGETFDIHLTMGEAFSVLVGLNLGGFVPSPGSLGTMETAGTAALVLFGAERSHALAFMFAYHLTQLAPGLAAGVAILVAEGELLFGRAPRAKTAPGAGTEIDRG